MGRGAVTKEYVMAAKATAGSVRLERIVRHTAEIEVKGTAPLIVHAWSQKAREMILAKQMGKKVAKEAKDPQAQYEESRYLLADGSDGFPMLAFKAATVGGARYFSGVTMTQLRQVLLFHADGYAEDGTALMRLKTTGPRIREDMVRVGMGTADIRYRAEYVDWGVTLRVEFIPDVIDLQSVIALVDAGGMGGVGEWRPEKDGAFGTFEVVA